MLTTVGNDGWILISDVGSTALINEIHVGAPVTNVLWLGRSTTERFLAATTSTGILTIWMVDSERPGSNATLVDSQDFSNVISIMDFNAASRRLLIAAGPTVTALSLSSKFLIMQKDDIDQYECDHTIRGAALLTSGTYAIVAITHLKRM